jgi:membrane protease YdiL (CAAX protease family)
MAGRRVSSPRMSEPPRSRGQLSSLPAGRHPLAVGAAVTILVAALSYAAPLDYAATVVGAAFVVATVVLVLRHDAETIRHFGLSLGGVLEPTPLDRGRLARSAWRAVAWAVGLLAIIAVPFAVGFRIYWHVRGEFHVRLPPRIVDELLGQLLVIALPEEAFYRGYLMTALDDAWGTPWNVAGAKVGLGLIVSSALFAVGHVLTEPDAQRLAVFFPALVFGWLRARTGGIGAPLLFHALCNLLAEMLTRGYALGS